MNPFDRSSVPELLVLGLYALAALGGLGLAGEWIARQIRAGRRPKKGGDS